MHVSLPQYTCFTRRARTRSNDCTHAPTHSHIHLDGNKSACAVWKDLNPDFGHGVGQNFDLKDGDHNVTLHFVQSRRRVRRDMLDASKCLLNSGENILATSLAAIAY